MHIMKKNPLKYHIKKKNRNWGLGYMKILVKLFFLFSLVFCMLPSVNAEQKIIQTTGTYTVGGGQDEKPSIAKERARQDAVRRAKDEAGVLVRSYSKVEDGMLIDDDLMLIVSNLLQIQQENYHSNVIGNNVLEYFCQIKAIIDTDGIMQELEKLKSQNDKLQNENATIGQQIGNAQQQNKEIEEKIKMAPQLDEWYQKAMDVNTSDEEKLDLTNRMIEKNPDYRQGVAYFIRGSVFEKQNKYSAAQEMNEIYSQKNPYDDYGYYALAVDSYYSGNINTAEKNIFSALALDSSNANYKEMRDVIMSDIHRKIENNKDGKVRLISSNMNQAIYPPLKIFEGGKIYRKILNLLANNEFVLIDKTVARKKTMWNFRPKWTQQMLNNESGIILPGLLFIAEDNAVFPYIFVAGISHGTTLPPFDGLLSNVEVNNSSMLFFVEPSEIIDFPGGEVKIRYSMTFTTNLVEFLLYGWPEKAELSWAKTDNQRYIRLELPEEKEYFANVYTVLRIFSDEKLMELIR